MALNNDPYRPVWIIAFLVGGLIVLVGISHFRRGKDLVPWREDLPTARAEAARDHRPMLLYFTAEWCGPCQEMRRSTWTSPRVEAALRRYVPVRIDIDREPKLAREHGVEGIPHMEVVDESGKTIKEYEGAMWPDDFLNWLKG